MPVTPPNVWGTGRMGGGSALGPAGASGKLLPVDAQGGGVTAPRWLRGGQVSPSRDPGASRARLPRVLLTHLFGVHVKFFPAHGYLFVPLHVFPETQPAWAPQHSSYRGLRGPPGPHTQQRRRGDSEGPCRSVREGVSALSSHCGRSPALGLAPAHSLLPCRRFCF